MRDLSAGPLSCPFVDLAYFPYCYHYRVNKDVCNTQTNGKRPWAKSIQARYDRRWTGKEYADVACFFVARQTRPYTVVPLDGEIAVALWRCDR
jgi:hypothetical protein